MRTAGPTRGVYAKDELVERGQERPVRMFTGVRICVVRLGTRDDLAEAERVERSPSGSKPDVQSRYTTPPRGGSMIPRARSIRPNPPRSLDPVAPHLLAGPPTRTAAREPHSRRRAVAGSERANKAGMARTWNVFGPNSSTSKPRW